MPYSERIDYLKTLPQDNRAEKRTFILLLILTCFVVMVGAVVLWLVPFIGFSNIHPKLPIIMAILFTGAVMFMIGGALTLVFTIIRGKNLFFNRRIRGVVIRVLFPILVLLGKCLGIKIDKIRRSFVAINNQLVLTETEDIVPQKLLILLPQCLQNYDCGSKVTGNVENCQLCGKCKIKDIVGLSKKYHTPIAVATGGTLARKIVIEKRPDMIIGVACERDLTSGIQDTYPIPVYGILNKRPNGPCYNTDVDLEMIEQGVTFFLRHKIGKTEEPGPENLERAVQ